MKTKRTIIKNTRTESIEFFHRALWCAIFSVFLLTALSTRLYYLQINQHQRYRTLSNDNRVSLLPVSPKRGLLLDRNGIVLADNIPSFSLELTRDKVPNLEKTIEKLKTIITLTDSQLQLFYKQLKRKRRFQAATVRMSLSEEEVARFSVNRFLFPGVAIKARLIRRYPQGAPFAHALGYVGRINEKELNLVNNANYSATQFIGKTGVEKFYENELHGHVGHQEVETNAQGKIVRVLKYQPPIPGTNLFLTIDAKLQAFAIKQLKNLRGAVVALEPNTGEVLALVSNPSFNPNQFVTGIDTKSYKNLQDAADRPLFNRAIRGQYAPASTIKPIVALKGLDSQAITPQQEVYDPGFYQLKHDSHQYRDWKSHGWVNLARSIYESCDTYYYALAHELKIDKLYDIFTQFGFGSKTGIDMAGELTGLMPSSRWKRSHMHQPWYPGETLITGIGQGFMLTTPLQLARATSIIAKKGANYKPHLKLAMQTNEGEITPANNTEMAPVGIQNPLNWDIIIDAMQQVIKNPHGTAHRISNDLTYTLAGKTGTAQVFSMKADRSDYKNVEAHLRDNSLFIGFAPVKRPKVAIAVIVENAPENVKTSVIARHILDFYLKKQVNS